MKKKLQLLLIAITTAFTTYVWAIQQGAGSSPHGGTLDTSYAVEKSYACLNCHGTNQQLVDQYSQSLMTHAMVKCNACHGTHTAAEVGQPKPNITGFQPGMGATGYVMGKDRCLVCHNAIQSSTGHPAGRNECISCHAPHIFPVNK